MGSARLISTCAGAMLQNSYFHAENVQKAGRWFRLEWSAAAVRRQSGIKKDLAIMYRMITLIRIRLEQNRRAPLVSEWINGRAL